MEGKHIQLKYEDVGGMAMAEVMQKLANTQTNNRAASHINKILKRVQAAREKISALYKEEIMPEFFAKDAEGNWVINQDTQEYTLKEGVTAEQLAEKMKEFNTRTIEIDWRPLGPSALVDVKLSARDLNALGDLYTEQDGPGIPEFSGLSAVR